MLSALHRPGLPILERALKYTNLAYSQTCLASPEYWSGQLGTPSADGWSQVKQLQGTARGSGQTVSRLTRSLHFHWHSLLIHTAAGPDWPRCVCLHPGAR